MAAGCCSALRTSTRTWTRRHEVGLFAWCSHTPAIVSGGGAFSPSAGFRTRHSGGAMPLSTDPERRKRQIANLRRAPSDDPVKRERQLQNLRPAPPAPIGNSRRLLHGGRSERLVADVEVEVREMMDALGDAAPVRDPDGGLPAADVVAVEVGARALKRWRHLSAYNDLHGRIHEKTGRAQARGGSGVARRAADDPGTRPVGHEPILSGEAGTQSGASAPHA